MMKGIIALAVILLVVNAAAPIGVHYSAHVKAGSEVIVNLRGYDTDGDVLTAKITKLPATGELYQLSQVFNDYGYAPTRGVKVSSVGTIVTGSNNRIIYVPPRTPTPKGAWTTFEYTVSDVSSTSEPGIVWITPDSGSVVESLFTNSVEDWTIDQNGNSGKLLHQKSSFGRMSRYIHSTDDEIHQASSGSDMVQWYFVAPSKFLGNHIIMYNGRVSFDLAAHAGNFKKQNSQLDFVELKCDSCAMGAGIRLLYRASSSSFNGSITNFSITFNESKWLKDPKNSLTTWTAPTQCEMVEVLAGLTSVRILGDFTTWVETVALDNVKYIHGNGVPIQCADIYY
eukprot:TRINITY_DN6771_c0_g1_i1.p1 TRINITY_DN6771_c0_g1~~TRINITY_DN6771_c0_g1_i1.p1  ORF type:complete len:361 (+),score=65.51 TRINITY_DN6771_c0_g1_i1:65-1084(+)